MSSGYLSKISSDDLELPCLQQTENMKSESIPDTTSISEATLITTARSSNSASPKPFSCSVQCITSTTVECSEGGRRSAPVMKGSFVIFDWPAWGSFPMPGGCFLDARGAAYREATAEYCFAERATFWPSAVLFTIDRCSWLQCIRIQSDNRTRGNVMMSKFFIHRYTADRIAHRARNRSLSLKHYLLFTTLTRPLTSCSARSWRWLKVAVLLNTGPKWASKILKELVHLNIPYWCNTSFMHVKVQFGTWLNCLLSNASKRDKENV